MILQSISKMGHKFRKNDDMKEQIESDKHCPDNIHINPNISREIFMFSNYFQDCSWNMEAMKFNLDML